jgi:membrane protease YdiL (CAAX protease family)
MSSNNGISRTIVSDATGKSKLVLILMPPILVVTMFIIFQILTNSRGFHTGYLLSFVIYWVAWGTIFPILILGTPRGLPNFFSQPRIRRFSKSATNSKNWLIIQVLIWLPIVFPLIFSFFPRIPHLEPTVIIVSIIIGVVTGVTEEILWRGVYIRKFPSSKFFGIIYILQYGFRYGILLHNQYCQIICRAA